MRSRYIFKWWNFSICLFCFCFLGFVSARLPTCVLFFLSYSLSLSLFDVWLLICSRANLVFVLRIGRASFFFWKNKISSLFIKYCIYFFFILFLSLSCSLVYLYISIVVLLLLFFFFHHIYIFYLYAVFFLLLFSILL